MILEKNKVYKIFHNPSTFRDAYPRDYVLVCPNRSLSIPDDFIKGKAARTEYRTCHTKRFDCLFIVCLDGGFSFNRISSISEDSYLEPLNDGDLKDIRKALNGIIGDKYKYNRKLNKLIEIKNDTEEGTSI
jgi:hypothetical protein